MKLFGITDLAKRWNYTKQGLHQKQKTDDSFPKPVAKINQARIQVFLEKDIIEYEQKRRELTDLDYKNWYQKKWCFSQNN